MEESVQIGGKHFYTGDDGNFDQINDLILYVAKERLGKTIGVSLEKNLTKRSSGGVKNKPKITSLNKAAALINIKKQDTLQFFSSIDRAIDLAYEANQKHLIKKEELYQQLHRDVTTKKIEIPEWNKIIEHIMEQQPFVLQSIKEITKDIVENWKTGTQPESSGIVLLISKNLNIEKRFLYGGFDNFIRNFKSEFLPIRGYYAGWSFYPITCKYYNGKKKLGCYRVFATINQNRNRLEITETLTKPYNIDLNGKQGNVKTEWGTRTYTGVGYIEGDNIILTVKETGEAVLASIHLRYYPENPYNKFWGKLKGYVIVQKDGEPEPLVSKMLLEKVDQEEVEGNLPNVIETFRNLGITC